MHSPLMFVFFETQNCSENIPMRTETETIYDWKTTIFPMWIRIAKTQIESLQSKRRKKPSRYLTGLTICSSSHPNTHTQIRKTNTCLQTVNSLQFDLGKFCQTSKFVQFMKFWNKKWNTLIACIGTYIRKKILKFNRIEMNVIIFSGRNTVLPSHQPRREHSPISPTTNERCRIKDWTRMAFTASQKVRIVIRTAIIQSILGKPKHILPLNFAAFLKRFNYLGICCNNCRLRRHSCLRTTATHRILWAMVHRCRCWAMPLRPNASHRCRRWANGIWHEGTTRVSHEIDLFVRRRGLTDQPIHLFISNIFIHFTNLHERRDDMSSQIIKWK